MSYPFYFDRDVIWDPALGVGQMFLGLANGAAQVLGMPSRLNPRVNGTCRIDDRRTFELFVEQLWKKYDPGRAVGQPPGFFAKSPAS